MEKISTGSRDVDKWLGGYDCDTITTFYGPAGSGKTNFCVLAAASIARRKKVIFIDTEGGFSVERLRQITNSQQTENVFKNILLLKPTNFYEQKLAFDRLLREIKNNKDIELIVVDGMTMLYRLESGQARSEKNNDKIRILNRMLAKQLRILAEIARKKYIPIIITNQIYHDFLSQEEIDAGVNKEDRIHMVGGDLLTYWSKCLIEIQNRDGKRRAILRKHRSLPEKEFPFIITNLGIEKAGFKIFS